MTYFKRFTNLAKKFWAFLQRINFFTWCFRLFAASVVAFAALCVYYSFSLPDPNRLLDRNVAQSTKILARDGSLLYEIAGEYRRTKVDLKDVSPYVKNATVALEDKDFYVHSGISFRGIFRAILVDILHFQKREGGSTITQQFVKNALLTRDKAYSRKLKEIILSIMIDARFTKDQILAFYLNEIPYGRNAYGIESAAQRYFGKHASELTLAESAYMAAITNAPSYFNPLGPNRKALDDRKNTTLNRMLDQKYITQEEYNQAKEEKVEFKSPQIASSATHFVFYVQDYLVQQFGEKSLPEGGYKVTTTIDPVLQKLAEDTVREYAEINTKKYNAHNAAMVVIDPKTGQILAMVGGKDYFGKPFPEGCTPGKNCLFEGNVNAALSERQPGSSIKPYVYATGFKKEFGYSPATVLMDVTTVFGTTASGKDYTPQNYDLKNRGPVSVRSALAGSLNIPAVKMTALVKPENVAATARSMGITSPLTGCGLALGVGACEVKLIDHTSALGVFAAGGVRHEKNPLLKIEDKDGKTLYEFEDKAEQIIDPQVAFLIQDIMSDNQARSYIFGVNNAFNFGSKHIACKSGTTQNWHDGWAMCFTPSLSVGVWTGNNDGTLMKKSSDGSLTAGPMVKKFLQEALKGKPDEKWIEPDGIQHVAVDVMSGKLPTTFSTQVRTEIFAEWQVPTERDDVHRAVKINVETGEPADETTPDDMISIKNYTILHSERPDNPAWEEPVQRWAVNAGYEYPTGRYTYATSSDKKPNGQGPEIVILTPQDGEVVSGSSLTVTVQVPSGAKISRMDLFIDGELIQSKFAEPYIFAVSKNLSLGDHTIAVHAVDDVGNTSDTSSVFTYSATPQEAVPPNELLQFIETATTTVP
ncbi:MAG TPA: penicillin-binding protein [Patescibacteria group bacterium]|nr:penicillin-binding protein [Patescibacteria group bacterium]